MKKTLSTLLLVSTSLLVACNNNDNQGEQEETNDDNATVSIEDARGESVSLPEDPERLAVFDNGQLDILQDLGLSDRVVVTSTENFPEHLEEFGGLPVAGTLHEVDYEITNSNEPDMGIVAGRSRDSYDGLSEFLPTIDLSNNDNELWPTIQRNLDIYSQIFDVEEEAEQIENNLTNQLEELQQSTEESDLSTLFIMTNEGSLSAYGTQSRFGFIHDLFGFEPVDEGIESSRHGMDISYEYILEQDPDVIFVMDRSAAIGGEDSGEFAENSLIQQTTAYETDQIIHLSPDVWYLSEGGTQAFSTMMEEVNTVFE